MAKLHELREIALSFPFVSEEYPWEHIVWKVHGKIFAITSDPGESISFASTLERQSALIQDPAISVASHVGRYGWITVDLSEESAKEAAKALMVDSFWLIVSRLSKRKQAEIAMAIEPHQS